MTKSILIFFYSFLFFLFIVSCIGEKNEKIEKNSVSQEEKLLKINKYLIAQDADKILAYVKRRNWNMSVTGTGLWYMIYQKGAGKTVRTGSVVSLNYTVSLLDGTPCYSSDSLGQKKFRVGKGGVERGLEEGILFLHAGDKARFIMPPHLAYGLTGDQDKIPSRSIIVYDVELVKISD